MQPVFWLGLQRISIILSLCFQLVSCHTEGKKGINQLMIRSFGSSPHVSNKTHKAGSVVFPQRVSQYHVHSQNIFNKLGFQKITSGD